MTRWPLAPYPHGGYLGLFVPGGNHSLAAWCISYDGLYMIVKVDKPDVIREHFQFFGANGRSLPERYAIKITGRFNYFLLRPILPQTEQVHAVFPFL
jgi:hypothetical protein